MKDVKATDVNYADTNKLSGQFGVGSGKVEGLSATMRDKIRFRGAKRWNEVRIGTRQASCNLLKIRRT